MSATGEHISVLCKCGKKLKAPASAIGRKAKCPKCGNVLIVEAPPPKEENDLDALYDLAAESEQAAKQQDAAPRCPQCVSPMAPGAVLCTNCGYDTRTGKSLAAKAAVSAPSRPAATGTRYDPAAAAAAAAAAEKRRKTGPKDAMAPQKSFWRGLACSAAGAAIGGMIWFAVAYGTGYELFFLILVVGALAGVGMQWGQQGYSYLGGFAAAGITFITMVIARLAVIFAMLIPVMKADFMRSQAEKEAMRMPDLSMYDERVVDHLHTEQLKLIPEPQISDEEEEAELSEDEDIGELIEEAGEQMDAWEKREIAAYQAVEKKLQQMPKAEHDALAKKLYRQHRDQQLDWLVTEDILLHDMHYHPSRAGEVLTNQARKAAQEKIAKMDDAQRDAEYKRLTDAADKKEKEELAKVRAERAAARARGEDDDTVSSGALFAIGGIVIFFLIFGGIKGAIFTLLALGLAYRTASGSVSDS